MDSQSVWYMQQMFNAMWILKDLREEKVCEKAWEGMTENMQKEENFAVFK